MTLLWHKKKELLTKKYGLFRAITHIEIQKITFVKTAKKYINDIEMIRPTNERIILIDKLCKYLCTTQDIWTVFVKLSDVFRDRLHEFSNFDSRFKKYLYSLEFICRYPKRNKQLCDKKVESGLCATHEQCHNRLKERIANSIETLPSYISKIIFEYTSPI